MNDETHLTRTPSGAGDPRTYDPPRDLVHLGARDDIENESSEERREHLRLLFFAVAPASAILKEAHLQSTEKVFSDT